VVAYLNDDYEGGEITFTSVGSGGITIKPEAGSAVFFPSNFVGSHTISEVKNGTRYAVPNWYHNRLEKVESDGSE
jgi:predicted 2-oxoglutarate/Fe(II)-dependent dioxygenase YbiX